MRNLYRALSSYYGRRDFREFQNKLSEDVYKSLGNSYSNLHNEVKMVTELCELLDNINFEKFTLSAKKIHGSKSYVQFKNRDKIVTTELADMVIITTATQNRSVVFEKVAFVQNKKESSDGKWKIDSDQLYLLKNFPSFIGTKGIFNQSFSKQSISYRNQSNALGMYGLFADPGEMTLVSADLVNRYNDRLTLDFDKIRAIEKIAPFNYTLPFDSDPMFIEDMYYYMMKRGFPFFNFSNMPFLQNSIQSLDIYEFIRNWTLFNIGEPVVQNGIVLDEQLKSFNDVLLKNFENVRSISSNVNDINFDGEILVLVLKLEL